MDLKQQRFLLGIFHFDQIAKFTTENIDWVNNHLSFKGRVEREHWVEQATKLAEGQETEFSRRYDDADND